MMPMVEHYQRAVQLAAHSLVLADAKDLGDLVGGETKQSKLAGAFEDFVDGEMPPEQKIAAVFDLVQRVLAAQEDGGPIFLGELRPQDQGPVVQAFTDNLRAEAIGGCLERFHVGDPQKGFIVFAEANTLALEFPGDEGMTIEVVRSLKGEEGTDAGRLPDHGLVPARRIVWADQSTATMQFLDPGRISPRDAEGMETPNSHASAPPLWDRPASWSITYCWPKI
jgi:hypothetical protein